MARDQILVVEDNARNMTLLNAVLQATGYRTLRASTGRQAFTLAVKHRPALVLMDVRLPDIDGVEALRLLRTDPRTSATAVLAVTAQAMKGDRERFLGLGFDGYLSKPLDVDELLAAVRTHFAPGRTAGPPPTSTGGDS